MPSANKAVVDQTVLLPCLNDLEHTAAQLFAVVRAVVHAGQRDRIRARLVALVHQRRDHAHRVARTGRASLHILDNHRHQLALNVAQRVALFGDREADHLQQGVDEDLTQLFHLGSVRAVRANTVRDGRVDLALGRAVRL